MGGVIRGLPPPFTGATVAREVLMNHSRGGVRARDLALPTLAVAVALFLLRASRQSPDALDYALAIRTGEGLWHPHHLLFAPACRLVLLILTPLGSPDAILAAQVHNILWAAAAPGALLVLGRRLGGDAAWGWLVAAMLVSTRAFWVYGTLAEAYLPVTGCAALLAASVLGRNGAWSARRTAGVAILLALAVLYHQTAALLAIPLGLAAATGRDEAERRGLGLAIVAAGAAVIVTYVLVYAGTEAGTAAGDAVSDATGAGAAADGASPLAGFLRWTLRYPLAPVADWGSWRHLSPAGLRDLVASQLVNVIVFPARWRTVAVLLGILAATVLLLLVLVRGGPDRALRRERGFLLVWLASHATFFLWWLPSDTDFFVVSLVPLLLLVLLGLRDWLGPRPRGGRLVAMGVLVLAVLAVNLGATVWPLHRSRGPAAERARAVAAVAADCVVLTDLATQQHLRYDHGRVMALDLDALWSAGLDDRPGALREVVDAAPCLLVAIARHLPTAGDVRATDPDLAARWLALLCELLDVAWDPRGEAVGCRDFGRVVAADGTAWLRIERTLRDCDGLAGLVRDLDAAVAPGSSAASPGPLRLWLDETIESGRAAARADGD
jgi:hypothetical protein